MSTGKKQYDKDHDETPAYREIPNSRRNRNRLQEILAHKQGGKLLEIGCGKGEFLKLAERYFDVGRNGYFQARHRFHQTFPQEKSQERKY